LGSEAVQLTLWEWLGCAINFCSKNPCLLPHDEVLIPVGHGQNLPPYSKLETRNSKLGSLCLLHFLDKGWHDVEEISDYRVVGDFEDWRLGVLVHRDDGAGSLHPYDMLNRAADTESKVKLGCDGLA